ncbi:MAG: hypothetical protein CK530_10600 [Planctomycetaceae bacterium]|nr:MAG: hypothetical protein CK530_10600 [Planctomycetaceae bacterium]
MAQNASLTVSFFTASTTFVSRYPWLPCVALKAVTWPRLIRLKREALFGEDIFCRFNQVLKTAKIEAQWNSWRQRMMPKKSVAAPYFHAMKF